MKVKVGIIGLGRMGNALAERSIADGHEVIGFDPVEQTRISAHQLGVTIVDTIAALCQQVNIIWLMVPVNVVESVLEEVRKNIHAGAIVVDGGNSFYKDSQRRARILAAEGIAFLDCGTSGGVHGRADGFCLMVGGDTAAYAKVCPLFISLAAPGGLAYVGPSGAGHYVKMVHNGIEYGLLEAYAEGFQLLKKGSFAQNNLNLEEIARIWKTSSVIRSWILELTRQIFEEDQALTDISGKVEETGMGTWTIQEAHENKLPVEVIEDADHVRAWSRETGGDYRTKIIALLRNKFGGHSFKKIKDGNENI
jgi:6-phosphogluconate dehydrogenase